MQTPQNRSSIATPTEFAAIQALERQFQNRGGIAAASAWLRSITTTLLAVILFLAGIESFFALVHVGEDEYLRMDAVAGYAHIPGKLVTYRLEGYSQEKMSSAGLRDIEHEIVKPAGVTRIAVVGDSKTEALQVQMRDNFVRRLQDRLNELASAKFETINFAMSGHSTAQEYLTYIKDAVRYKPDYLLVVYHIFDSAENVEGDNRMFCRFNRDGRMYLDWSMLDEFFKSDSGTVYRALDYLHSNSRTYSVLSRAWSNFLNDKTGQKLSKLLSSQSSRLTAEVCRALPPYEIPQSAIEERDRLQKHVLTHAARKHKIATGAIPTIFANDGNRESVVFKNMAAAEKRKLETTCAILTELNDECRRNGCKMVLAGLPGANNLYFYTRELRTFKELAKREKFGFIDVQAAFPERGPTDTDDKLYYCGGHFTPKGHDLVTETLLRNYDWQPIK